MSQITCQQCQGILPPEIFNSRVLVECPSCQVLTRAFVFPALFKAATPGNVGERILVEGDAGCFYHPHKKATVHCDRCGRFLCALCDVDLGAEHVCPACLQSAAQKGKLTTVEQRRRLYDNIAMALALYPLLFPFVIPFTAVAAIIVAVRYWNAPGSLIPRRKTRFIMAIIISTVELLGVVAIIVGVIAKARQA